MKMILITNLALQVAEDDLRQLFGNYGQVARIIFMTDSDTGRLRGFALVEMTNMSDGKRAIDQLNGSQFCGRTLNVSEAHPLTMQLMGH